MGVLYKIRLGISNHAIVFKGKPPKRGCGSEGLSGLRVYGECKARSFWSLSSLWSLCGGGFASGRWSRRQLEKSGARLFADLSDQTDQPDQTDQTDHKKPHILVL